MSLGVFEARRRIQRLRGPTGSPSKPEILVCGAKAIRTAGFRGPQHSFLQAPRAANWMCAQSPYSLFGTYLVISGVQICARFT